MGCLCSLLFPMGLRGVSQSLCGLSVGPYGVRYGVIPYRIPSYTPPYLTEPTAHDVTAQVTAPSGTSMAAQVLEGERGAYSIRFVPEESGVHSVSVKDRGQHVPGSPFQFTVGPLGEGGAHKVRAGGPGLERAETGVPGEFGVPYNP